jgi:hypothetical protein
VLEPPAVLIHDADHQVVAMQVDSCHELLCHLGFLSVLRCLFLKRTTTFLPEGNLPSPRRL